MWAATYGYTEIASILIQTDTNMFIKDKNGTALNMATEKGHTQTAELIKQKIEMEQEYNMGNTSIYDMSRWF